MSNHDDEVLKIVSVLNSQGYLKSRESNTVEFKQSFNAGNTAAYAKTMAAFANNRGGYIVFGIKDNPREVVGIKSTNFDNLNQEKFAGAINSLFSPEIVWECGSFTITSSKPVASTDNEEINTVENCIGWIYTEQAELKPVIAQKENSSEHIVSGDVYYRYRAKNEKIKFAEMNRIVEERIVKGREELLKLFEIIRKSDTANLGIVNYSNGKITTPYGVDVAFDRRLVAQVLKKAKFIKEGSFNETEGIPVIKVTGNIDLAEEVPVPELDPQKSHPYIQREMAEKLEITTQDLYALIWYFKMKESLKYHYEASVSRNSSVHKFSDFALQFLEEKLRELRENDDEFNKIRAAYRNRDKLEEQSNA